MSEYLERVQQLQRMALGFDISVGVEVSLIEGMSVINTRIHKFDAEHFKIVDSQYPNIREWASDSENDLEMKRFKNILKKYEVL